MNRLDRLIAILLYLQSRPLTRAQDIAAKFKITKRTAYRDLVALGQAGVPLIAQAGVGYSIAKHFHLQPVMFTADEAAALAIGGLLVQQFAGTAFTEHMSSALLKIRNILPSQLREHMDTLEHSMRPLRSPAHHSALSTLHSNLLPIQDAIAKRHVLRFRYRGAGRTDTTAREVEPMAVIIYLQHWRHPAAGCACEARTARRAQRLCLGPLGFLPRLTGARRPSLGLRLHQTLAFQFPIFNSSALDRLLNPKQTVTARIKATHLAAERARREAFLGVSDEKQTEDAVELTLHAANRDWLINWLLSFGTAVNVISPVEIRQRLANAATEVARHHSPTL